jgi:hypothetical protein
VFQELSLGLARYHDAVQIILWPFPYPYAQLCHYLIHLHMILTPLMFSKATSNPEAACILTFIAVLSVKGLDVIAEELENPFGTDDNDLPCQSMHRDMNHDLIMLLDDRIWACPTLSPRATTSVKELYEQNRACNESVESADIYQAGSPFELYTTMEESCQKRQHHHLGLIQEIELEPHALRMLKLEAYFEINGTKSLELEEFVDSNNVSAAKEVARPECILEASDNPSANGQVSPLLEDVVVVVDENREDKKPVEPQSDWRELVTELSKHMNQLLQRQHEQMLVAQEMFFQKLKLAPTTRIPSMQELSVCGI